MKNKYLLSIVIGVILLVSTMLMGILSGVLVPSLMSQYENPAFRAMTDPVMGIFFIYPVVLGVCISYVWFRTRKAWKSGVEFGAVMGVLLNVPMFLVNFSNFTFPLMLIGSWFVFGFVNCIIAGMALEKLEG